MCFFDLDKIAEDFGPIIALVLFFFWPLMFCLVGIIARIMDSENSKFNKKVESFLHKYLVL